ncbi:MAG: NAD(P)-dependent oxidoreductase, partial [Methylocapsa sp.]|nr:NAD(P)-dependent oxidoreductase [Methylocapsa sp.]
VVDGGCIWAAFVLGQLAGEGYRFSDIAIRTPAQTIAFGALFAACACAAYAAGGLYDSQGSTLTDKVQRTALINLGFFLAACTLAASLEELSVSKVHNLLMSFAGATAVLCAARAGADVVRREVRNSQPANVNVAPDERETNILVIGGAGYIGSVLVGNLLEKGMRVTILDAMHFGGESIRRIAAHPNLTLVRDDFRHVEALIRIMSGAGSVVHLGGLVGDPACSINESVTIDVNVTATKIIADIAKAAGVRRFVFASSCSVYGICDETATEAARFNPQSLYARTKVASEVVLDGLNSPEFAVTRLRFGTIYGVSGRTRFDLVVNLLCAKAVRDGVITLYGADQVRPFVHVEDVAAAILLTLQAPAPQIAGEIFNVGSDAQNYTLGDVASMIKRQVPKATIVSDDTFVDKRNYRVSFEKIRTRLGFEPAWTLERGIAQVAALVRSNDVGHYTDSIYSNVMYLKKYGTENFANFMITGWEAKLMKVEELT